MTRSLAIDPDSAGHGLRRLLAVAALDTAGTQRICHRPGHPARKACSGHSPSRKPAILAPTLHRHLRDHRKPVFQGASWTPSGGQRRYPSAQRHWPRHPLGPRHLPGDTLVAALGYGSAMPAAVAAARPSTSCPAAGPALHGPVGAQMDTGRVGQPAPPQGGPGTAPAGGSIPSRVMATMPTSVARRMSGRPLQATTSWDWSICRWPMLRATIIPAFAPRTS